jgi:hypothetical protein
MYRAANLKIAREATVWVIATPGTIYLQAIFRRQQQDHNYYD